MRREVESESNLCWSHGQRGGLIAVRLEHRDRSPELQGVARGTGQQQRLLQFWNLGISQITLLQGYSPDWPLTILFLMGDFFYLSFLSFIFSRDQSDRIGLSRSLGDGGPILD
jgi:hypothetical protein